MINGLTATTYWSKAHRVQAIRLTDDNLQKIADYIGAELCVKTSITGAYINHGGDEGHVGEWIVKWGGSFSFHSHEEFMRLHHTHDEQLSNDERYAKIFALVASAMAKQDAATYHQDQTGMDLLTIETVKKIIGEL
jgi:hypothetical protein